MLHIPDLAPRVYAYAKIYSTEYLKFICLTVYEVRPQNAIDRKRMGTWNVNGGLKRI